MESLSDFKWREERSLWAVTEVQHRGKGRVDAMEEKQELKTQSGKQDRGRDGPEKGALQVWVGWAWDEESPVKCDQQPLVEVDKRDSDGVAAHLRRWPLASHTFQPSHTGVVPSTWNRSWPHSCLTTECRGSNVVLVPAQPSRRLAASASYFLKCSHLGAFRPWGGSPAAQWERPLGEDHLVRPHRKNRPWDSMISCLCLQMSAAPATIWPQRWEGPSVRRARDPPRWAQSSPKTEK